MARRMCGPLTGPLVPYVERFRESLAEQGYSSHSVRSHVLLMGHVSRWLASEGFAASDLSGERARLFLGTRRARGYVHPASMAGMAPLLDYLGDIGTSPALRGGAELTTVGVLLGRFSRYLTESGAVTLDDGPALHRRGPRVFGALLVPERSGPEGAD